MSNTSNIKEFILNELKKEFPESSDNELLGFFNSSPLLKYINLKTDAIFGNTKSRRSLGNLYAVHSILHYYISDFYEKDKANYQSFSGYEFSKLMAFMRSLYGGSKLQNHALNSRVNGEFSNKYGKNSQELIVINNGKYLLHINYLYVKNHDISRLAYNIINKYIELLMAKDSSLLDAILELIQVHDNNERILRVSNLLTETSEARIFEIISYAILKNHYKNTMVYIGFSIETLEKQYLTLYKTGRTNANDGGIDFVMRPLGRFFQVTEVNNYDKYLLDIDKVMHFPVTFIVKTDKTKESISLELQEFIEENSGGMRVITERYIDAIEEIITINELKKWLSLLDKESINQLLLDIKLYYELELNII